MIKIEIADIETKKKEYISSVKPAVVRRIENLIISLKHLNGDPIVLNDGVFDIWKHISKGIFNDFILKNSFSDNCFNKGKYKATLEFLLTKSWVCSKLATLGIISVIKLLSDLLSNNGAELDKLLTCNAEELFKMSEDLLNRYNLNNDDAKAVLKYSFNYHSHDDVSGLIKSFFRENNFVAFCPYCNINNAAYIATEEENTAEVHQLDHFFDKAKNPLLSYSLFNLVPSCGTCNGPNNKGTIPFKNDFHLNPYIAGFKSEMVYEPILKGIEVIDINIKINADNGSAIRKQLFGSKEIIYENDTEGTGENELGNVNVFKLYTRYRQKKEIKSANNILRRLSTMNQGSNATESFFEIMGDKFKAKAHESWYETIMGTSLKETSFNDEAYSKFTKDIHDYYYKLDTKWRKGYINELIGQ